VSLTPVGRDPNVQLTLQDVLYVPDAAARYFSVSTLLMKGGRISFEGTGFAIHLNDRKLATGYMEASCNITPLLGS
jgi:hypothetical protein